MKRCIPILVVCLILAVCTVAHAGNKNDLAYKNLDELDTTSSVSTADGIIVSQSSVPYQGLTVSDLLKRQVTDDSVSNTTDTTAITAAETGKVFIAKQATKFQLPAAADGLTYTFVTGAAVEIEIQVATTPTTIVLADAGDGDGSRGVIETGGTNTTGNTITLASDGTDWYVTSKDGEWIDGGVWQQLNEGAQA